MSRIYNRSQDAKGLKKDKKAAAGILSLVLWAALLTVLLHLLDRRSGGHLIEGLGHVVYWLMLCIAVFFFWWLLMGWRLRKFMKRLDKAGLDYLRNHDVDGYLLELDACCEMAGVRNMTLGGIPAMDYVTILKIRTLREAGRERETSALLETAKQEMKGEKTLLLLRDEEEKLDRRQK